MPDRARVGQPAFHSDWIDDLDVSKAMTAIERPGLSIALDSRRCLLPVEESF